MNGLWQDTPEHARHQKRILISGAPADGDTTHTGLPLLLVSGGWADTWGRATCQVLESQVIKGLNT